MKKLLVSLSLLILLITCVTVYADITVDGDAWSSVSYYDKTEFEAGLNVSISSFSNSPDGKISFQLVESSFSRQGVDIFSRDGSTPIFSAREWYAQRSNIKIGRQTFVDEEGYEFDFIDLNPFGVRDLSVPFSSLESSKSLGNWGVSARFMDDRLQLIGSFFEPPIIAVDDDNPWTRKLSSGMYYGSILGKSNYSVGFRWLDSFNDETSYYSIFAQRGSGNSPVDISINSFGEVRPVIAEQTSIGVTGQFQFLDYFTTRLGGVEYFQEGYGNFMVVVLENGRIWENAITGGDSLFVNVGYADVAETKSGPGVPDLDLRRIYEGGTALITAEYSFGDWVFKIKGAYNFSEKGMYIAPEISWFVSDSVEASLKYESIDGRKDSGPNSIWAEHSDDDNILLKVTFTF